MQRRDYDAARLIYEQLIESEGPALGRLMSLSIAFDSLGKHEEALEILDRAIELRLIESVDEMTTYGLDEIVYLNNRGVVLLHLDRFEEALTCLEKSIEHSHEGATSRILALISYGVVYARMKEKEAALEVQRHVREWFECHTISDPIAAHSLRESKRILTSEIAKLYDSGSRH
jgi:tetratricopeptide (TPR) repeat protein